MTRLFLLIPLCLCLASCKKDKTIELSITGKVRDQYQNTAIAGVLLELQVQELTGGTFNSSFKTIETTTTNSSGDYNFTFERRNAAEYRIIVTKSNYFGAFIQINPDHLTTNTDNVYNFELPAMAWLNVHVQNTGGTFPGDQVTFQLSSGGHECGDCCGDLDFTLTGAVDTTFTCLNTGGHQIVANGYYVSNGMGGTASETVTLTPFDTTAISITF